VKWLYAKDAGTVAEADDQLALIRQHLKDKKEQAKEIKKQMISLTTAIQLRMGEAATLLYQNKPLATWKTQSERRLDIDAIEAAHPEIVEAFRKTSEHRVLRLK
jgi:predicted phage-related endonuclease